MHPVLVKPRFLIAVFFILLVFLSPLVCFASDLDNKPSAVVKDDSQEQIKEQFKKAVELSRTGSYKDAEEILLKLTGDNLWKGKVYLLLGRIYKEQNLFDKAEERLIYAVGSCPLLKDYALKLLTDVYISAEKFDKAVETARQIQHKVLLKDARKSEITALFKAKREDETMDLLQRFTKDYSNEWELRLTLARLLKNHNKTDEAVSLFKKIYINAVPVSADALWELKDMKADTFTSEELLKRADNLFDKGNFQRAEETYREVLKGQKSESRTQNLPTGQAGTDYGTQKAESRIQNPESKSIIDKNKIIFSIGMCQFRLRQYDKAAKNFASVNTPEAMFWEGRAYNRINDEEGFGRIIKKFEKEYPLDERLAKLLLISADNLREAGKATEAGEIFKRIIKDFPQMTEDALWGLGWMSYTLQDYKSASEYFSKLSVSSNGDNQKKYLYWQMKSIQKSSENCAKAKVEGKNADERCPEKDEAVLTRISEGSGYYNYLVKSSAVPAGPLENSGQPAGIKRGGVFTQRPDGESYERIEALISLDMKNDAANEINAVIQKVLKPEEFLYLGYTAMSIGEYRKIIALTEEIQKDEFLPMAYPLGYWDIVKMASERENVDAYLVTAIIREESRFDPAATSNAGALGLMQLMPATAQRFKSKVKIELKDNSDIYDAEKNILIGAHYLSWLIKEFKALPYAIAAYNAGESVLQKWLDQNGKKEIDEFIEEIPYAETRKYVKKVLKSYWQYRAMEGLPAAAF
ncbi:MAG: transglycosylase SLT domain-containing protein [Nitrospirae bacterium]|nr:transglycosylase SLT domain-containing protein [Nitrospirota bacterium]